jgi:hypothetical protein
MTEFFPKDLNWDMDIMQHFITHLRDNICQEMNSKCYLYNSATAGKDTYLQLINLQLAFEAATIAEESITRVHKIAHNAVSSHSFSSVAEERISRYTGVKCWGCGMMGHGYDNKAGALICPNKDKPGVKEAAEEARKEFNDRLKKKKTWRKKEARRYYTSCFRSQFYVRRRKQSSHGHQRQRNLI